METNDEETAGKETGQYAYARRLMKNMGWGGQGLGLNESGITEPIRVRTRSKPTGLGFHEKQDQFSDRQEDFEEVLQKLRMATDNGNGQPSEPTEGNGFSCLEKKSRRSRSRVHYHKFTRGKDLSRCSEQDMQGILGKRKRDHGPSVEFVASTIAKSEQRTEKGSSCEVEVGSTEDELPKSKKRLSKKVSFRAIITDEHDVTEDTASTIEEDRDSSEVKEVTSKKRKKSKKKKKRSEDVAVLLEDNCYADDEASMAASDSMSHDSVTDSYEDRRKRKLKRKNAEKEECVNETNDSMPMEHSGCRKNRKHKKEGSYGADFCVVNGGELCLEDGGSVSEDAKRKIVKKRSKSRGHDVTPNGAVEHSSAGVPKKFKLRKDKMSPLESTQSSEEHFDHENKTTDEEMPGSHETTDENELQSKEETHSNGKRANKKGSPNKPTAPLQEASSTTSNLQLDNGGSSQKRNKASLSSLTRRMKNIQMFEGSNILDLTGYPE